MAIGRTPHLRGVKKSKKSEKLAQNLEKYAMVQ
jgi:hypothetical protein